MCKTLRAAGAVATLDGPDGPVVLVDDLKAVTHARSVPPPQPPEEAGTLPLPLPARDGNAPLDDPDWVSLPGGAYLVPAPGGRMGSPSLGPIVRLLCEQSPDTGRHPLPSIADTLLPGGWRLTGGGAPLHKAASDLVDSSERWARLADRDFANSAPYMGTKRALLPFVMTALERMGEPPTGFVDLMCGSGVVSGAAARQWRTVSSDSQAFCRALALVQGGGFTRDRAADTLRRLHEPMSNNLSSLTRLVEDLLSEEADLLTAAADWSVLAPRYADFVASTPGYPSGGRSGKWDPAKEVALRQVATGNGAAPYCLFTAYFANIYFGVRQAVELDCLRYAIDELADPSERDWALGALVVTASSVATTYGGHFAQPPAPPERLVHPGVARRVLARRHVSATREFEIRLLSLSAESEEIPNAIECVPGPWESALDAAARVLEPSQSVVYVDAPYRREEYSRYYHVLETLVSYTYPSADTSARVPKKGRERFSSEFFTRSRSSMTDALSTTIRSVLDAGFKCAWSYADRADADPLAVLEAVSSSCRRARSVATDHEFKRQGKSRGPGRVREFLFLLDPTVS